MDRLKKQNCGREEVSNQGKHVEKTALYIHSFRALSVATPSRSSYISKLIEKWRFRCIVFCSFFAALHRIPLASRNHLGVTRSVQQSKEGNCKTKLSNVHPERCHLCSNESLKSRGVTRRECYTLKSHLHSRPREGGRHGVLAAPPFRFFNTFLLRKHHRSW